MEKIKEQVEVGDDATKAVAVAEVTIEAGDSNNKTSRLKKAKGNHTNQVAVRKAHNNSNSSSSSNAALTLRHISALTLSKRCK